MTDLTAVYKQSEDLIAKEIEGQMVIVPLSSGVGDLNSEMYSLNQTGVAIWEKLDGKSPLKEIIYQISLEYEVSNAHIQKDVMDLITDLSNKGLIKKQPFNRG